SIAGGRIMAVSTNGMSLIGAPSERVMLVKGLVLLAAVAYDVWTKRRAAGRRALSRGAPLRELHVGLLGVGDVLGHERGVRVAAVGQLGFGHGQRALVVRDHHLQEGP